MTGIIENMQAAVVALQKEVASIKSQLPGLNTAAPTAIDPFAPVAAPANITAEQITQLITPHLDKDAVKTALGAEMRAMGIDALPNTQPDQYAELYERFQRVIAANSATAAAPAIII